MTAIELAPILADHQKWRNGEPGGERANLRGANLYGAKFAGCNLDIVSGIVWAAVGPTPEGRNVIAVWHGPDEGVIVHCGCGRNTPAEALAACDDTSDPKRCRKLVKRVVKDVTAWVDGLETA